MSTEAAVKSNSPAGQLYERVRNHGVDFFVSVPCSLLGEVIEILETDEDVTYTPVTREEEGIGILAGAYLAGRRPAIVMQNSGYGNIVNAVCSLTNYYNIPIVMLVSHRGSAGERIDAQVPMGDAVQGVMEASGVKCISVESPGDLDSVDEGIDWAITNEKSIAFLFPFSFWQDAESYVPEHR
jgi:sulfopyruvate decarboxylase subunit alpha|tara:strand:+ start:3121 stop:3669 length:549 start_codon:yes stop_codon:yes gene_type:complete